MGINLEKKASGIWQFIRFTGLRLFPADRESILYVAINPV
jgi:hypothetical protein